MARDTGETEPPFRLLSLSGGGCLGYYTACVLRALEERANAPLIRRFDMLAGTSIGGILALALAAGVSASGMEESFRRHGAEVFSGRAKAHGWMEGLNDLLRALVTPKYSAAKLRANLSPLLGETRLGDLQVPVMVTAIDVTDGSARLFSSSEQADRDFKAIDVAMATAAMPGFYPLARVGGGLYADGGLYANAPDLLALSQCEHGLGVAPGRIEMVSVGTASTRFALAHPRRRPMGALDWLMRERMVRLAISAQQSAAQTLMRRILGSRYLRIDAAQTAAEQDILGLDVATPDAQAILARLATESLKALDGNPLLRSILADEETG
jgi:predicted acylesterase/phospholipase RssA